MNVPRRLESQITDGVPYHVLTTWPGKNLDLRVTSGVKGQYLANLSLIDALEFRPNSIVKEIPHVVTPQAHAPVQTTIRFAGSYDRISASLSRSIWSDERPAITAARAAS
jgi:hypothetical protein